MPTVRRLFGSKLIGSCWARQKLFRVNPAPASRTTASATCVMTRAERARCWRTPPLPPRAPSSCNASESAAFFETRHAGQRPTRIPAAESDGAGKEERRQIDPRFLETRHSRRDSRPGWRRDSRSRASRRRSRRRSRARCFRSAFAASTASGSRRARRARRAPCRARGRAPVADWRHSRTRSAARRPPRRGAAADCARYSPTAASSSSSIRTRRVVFVSG